MFFHSLCPPFLVGQRGKETVPNKVRVHRRGDLSSNLCPESEDVWVTCTMDNTLTRGQCVKG